MGCKGECGNYPRTKLTSERAVYDNLKYCTTCEIYIDPNVQYRQMLTTSGKPAKPGKCPCCHNTLRTTSNQSQAQKEKVYGEAKRYDLTPEEELEARTTIA